MAIAFRGYDDVINESAVSTTTVPVPDGVAEGDVLVAAVATSAGGPIVPDEAGWTQLGDDFDAGNMRAALWWRLASSSEPASYGFTANGLGSSVGVMGAWSGCDQTTPVADSDSADTTADDTSLATTAVTVPADGWLVTLPLDRRNNASLEQSWASSDASDVRRGQISGSSGSGSVFSGAIIDSDRPLTAGDASRTITATRTWAQVLIWSIALKPAPAPAPEPTPRFPLQDRYELLLDGTWTDITRWVYDRDAVTITRGRSAEAETADPAQMTLTLDNRDGRFSPRNPMSPYYGLLGRNTPIRASLPYGSSYLRIVPGDDTSQATVPGSSALEVTGDFDIRVDVDADRWQAGDLAGRYLTTGDQRSWWLGVTAGRPQLIWSPDGTIANRMAVSATALLPKSRGRLAVRAVLDVDDGAGGHTLTFYTGSSIDGPWTQLGDVIAGTGTTGVHGGTASLEVGGVASLDVAEAGGAAVPGRYLAFEVRDGIDGPLVVSADFTGQAPGAAGFTDEQGNTWTVSDSAAIDDRRYRFYGEVGSWPQAWDASGRDAFSKITASGIRRRLGQGASPLRSTLYQVLTTGTPGTVAYWPCEDGQNATRLASAIPGAAPMKFTGSPDTGAYDDFVASDAVPVVKNSTWKGQVPSYAATGQTQLRFMLAIPDDGLTNGAVVARLLTSGTAARWDVVYTTALTGSLELRAYDAEGALLHATGTSGLLDDAEMCISVELTQSGSNVGLRMVTMRVDELLGTGVTLIGTVTNRTVGRATSVVIDPNGNVDDAAVGHVSVHSQISDPFDFYNELGAFPAETAADRFMRLCTDEGVPARVLGDLSATERMGPQGIETLVGLLDECAAADMGFLAEPADAFGLEYRTRSTMYNQTPAVTLDYQGGEIAGELRPVDDDQTVRNDITVSRTGGSSVRAVKETGPLSVQAPPDGVGRYDQQDEVNVAADSQLPDQAGWRLHLGTVDEARLPVLGVNFRATAVTDELAEEILGLDLGDRMVVTGLPPQLPPDDMSMLVQGYTETLRLMQHEIEFNLAPESPWRVAVVEGDGYDRIDIEGSTLAAPATATDTTLSVATIDGIVWTTDPADLPMDIMVGGERITVTAITGTSSPQTFAVARSVNGVVKAQTAGTAVTIADPVAVAL